VKLVSSLSVTEMQIIKEPIKCYRR
jgi:hypothetical protein